IPRTLSALLPFWWRRVQFGGRPTAESTGPSAAALALLMLVAGFLLFRGLAYPLMEPDEGRYAEIAREMWTSGDWIIPRLHQEPYLDKPPLFYWLCAGSYSLFGPSDWAARLVPAMAAWLTVGVTYLFGCRLLGRTSALLGTLAMILSIGFICCGRFLILDSLLALLVTTSLCSGYEATARTRFRWGWWILSAALCGLGVLTKGPVALVLLAPPVVADGWLNRHPQAPGFWRWAAYAGVVSVTTFPWYMAAIHRMPGFVQYFFWEQNIHRFLSGSNHPEPFWFYGPTLFLSCMPWGLLLIPVARSLISSSQDMRAARSCEAGFLVLWAAWCLLFFSASRSKLPTYILPCLPAIMLLIGHYLHKHCSPFAGNVFVRVKAHALFQRGILYLAASGIVLAGCLVLLELDGRVETVLHGSLWAGLLLGAMALPHRAAPATVYGVFCLAAFAATAKLTQDVFPAWANQRSVLGASQQSVEELQRISSGHPVACIAGDWGSVPFYLNRDDVAVFRNDSDADVRRFLEEQEASLLVIDDDVDLNQLNSVIPHNADVRKLTSTPKATVLAIQRRVPLNPGIRLMSAKLEEQPHAYRR
ncbi:MAG: phospholipid carrier-dependent glycosyltransferase, partial [Planctomycetaceae bacterium]